MSARYFPWFDLAQVNGGIVTFTRSGSSNFTVDLTTMAGVDYESGVASSIVSHWGSYQVKSYGETNAQRFRNFSTTGPGLIFRTAMRAAATTAGWPTPTDLFVTFDGASCRYTIGYSGGHGDFTIDWTSSVGRTLFGFASMGATDLTGASSYTGTLTPTYCTMGTLPDVSVGEDPKFYEPASIGNHVVSEDGTGTGISRAESPLYSNFRQEYETKAKTLRAYAVAADPFTFQHLFEHCRGVWPFAIISSSMTDAYSFRTEGIPFSPRRATPGNDAQFHIPFECICEGYLSLG